MVGASVAALTVYDMTKALAKSIRIEAVELLEKSGGRSGHWRADDGAWGRVVRLFRCGSWWRRRSGRLRYGGWVHGGRCLGWIGLRLGLRDRLGRRLEHDGLLVGGRLRSVATAPAGSGDQHEPPARHRDSVAPGDLHRIAGVGWKVRVLALLVFGIVGLAPGTARADGTEVHTWDRVEAGADLQRARWVFVGGVRGGALIGTQVTPDLFLGAGPTVGVRTTRFEDATLSAGGSALLNFDQLWQLRIDLTGGWHSASQSAVLEATAELGMGIALGEGVHRHRFGGGLFVSYAEHLDEEHRQLVVGFALQLFGALLTPLFIRP